MKPNHLIESRQATILSVLLWFASGACVTLTGIRFLRSHELAYFNLVWNLFLAWLPLVFAVLASCRWQSRRQVLLHAFLWLLFLPNAPYLLTDLVHLKSRPPVPLWFDILLVQSFVLTGLFLGFLSVYLMHRLVSRSFGDRTGWIFITVILGLTAFGIYLGRFARWNSWDFFLSPIALAGDAFNLLIHPRSQKTAVGFSTLCGGLLFLGYLVFYAMAAMSRAAPPLSTPRAGDELLAYRD